MKEEARTWKDALAMAVFEWQVFALSQPSRAEGWLKAASITYEMFNKRGGGFSLSLAANKNGPVVKSMAFTSANGWVDNTAQIADCTPPWDILKDLESRLRAAGSELLNEQSGFHSPGFALNNCAADQVARIAQKYACLHPRWEYVYFPGSTDGEPPWDGKRCIQCLFEVPADD